MLRNHHVGQPDGAGNLKSVSAGKPTAVQPHSNPTALKSASTPSYALGVPEAEQSAQSPGVTLHQSSRVKVRARAGKSKAKKTASLVARGPEHTTSYWGSYTQTASLRIQSVHAAQVASSHNKATPPIPDTGLTQIVMPAARPFQWATATAEEISRLPGLGSLPIDLIKSIIPELRAFVEEFENSTRSNSWAVDQGQNSPAERPELPRATQSIGLCLPTAQPGPSPLMEQLEHTLLVAGQLCELDESPASMPMFEELEVPQQQEENVGPKPNVECLLDPERHGSWGMEASQTSNSLTPPTREDIERLLCALFEGSNGPSDLGGSVGTGAVDQWF